MTYTAQGMATVMENVSVISGKRDRDRFIAQVEVRPFKIGTAKTRGE